MHITSEQLTPVGVQTGDVFWGPVWVDGMLGRLVRMPDNTTLAERWGTEGWSPDEEPTVQDLLRWGVPATPQMIKDLGIAVDPLGIARHAPPPYGTFTVSWPAPFHVPSP